MPKKKVTKKKPRKAAKRKTPRTPKKDEVRRQAQADKWRPAFLEALAETGNVKHAAEFAGIGRSTAYGAAERDDAFAALWAEAREDAAEVLEFEARRRAVDGVEEAVWHKGAKVGTVTKYSDVLLIFLLKGNNPEKFRERFDHEHAHHHTVSLEGLVEEAEKAEGEDEDDGEA